MGIFSNYVKFRLIAYGLLALDRNPSCRILITTGEGKYYCNGLDLDWASRNTIRMDDVGQALNDLIWRLMHFPLPTVAAVNG